MNYDLNEASVSAIVQIVDNSGLPVTDLDASTFPAVTLVRSTSTASLALSDLSAVDDAHDAGGIYELSGGRYRLDLPDTQFEAVGPLSIVAEESGKRLIHPQIQVTAPASGGGNRSVVIKVTDEDDSPIQHANVRLFLNGKDFRSTTDTNGITDPAFGLPDDGTWNVVVTSDGYTSIVTTLAISADIAAGDQVYALEQYAISPPSDAAYCTVSCVVRRNGEPDEGATITAVLQGKNNCVPGVVVRESLSATTNASGTAELELIRQDQFVDGSGAYKIVVTCSDGSVIAEVNRTIPNQSTTTLSDII